MSPTPPSAPGAEGSRAAELRLRAAVESAPSGLLMTDARGVVVLVNREVERLFGYSREELLGRPVESLMPERFRSGHAGFRGGFMADPRMRAMGAGRDLFGLRKDGTAGPGEIGLTPVAAEEGSVVRASVVAIGTLAGGFAHVFNIILFGITGYAELAGRAVTLVEARADLDELLRAAGRGRELVERILVFSRREPTERRPLEIGATVAEAARLLKATLPATIELKVTVHPQSPQVLADATAIHQIVMNLGTNSAHAMPRGGVLEILVELQYLRDSAVRSHPGLHEGPYAVLVVRDTGVGMDAGVRGRVFEPFFSTRPKGAGTGLGLSMVHSIMTSHEGVIDLDSAPGRGTTVSCFFPALPEAREEERKEAAEAPRGRGERVLLVDDEPSLAAMNKRRLEALGYAATVDSEPERALDMFRSRQAEFDLVISDYLMPKLTGLDFARAIHNLRPEVPIALLTGYIEELPEETLRAAGVRRLINKPVLLQELAAAVHALLAARAAAAR